MKRFVQKPFNKVLVLNLCTHRVLLIDNEVVISCYLHIDSATFYLVAEHVFEGPTGGVLASSTSGSIDTGTKNVPIP